MDNKSAIAALMVGVFLMTTQCSPPSEPAAEASGAVRGRMPAKSADHCGRSRAGRAGTSDQSRRTAPLKSVQTVRYNERGWHGNWPNLMPVMASLLRAC